MVDIRASVGMSEAVPVFRESAAGQSLPDWARERRPEIEALLRERGAVLFRGFDVASPEQFHDVALALTDALVDYVYRSTPRTGVSKQVYTATEYRADASIPFHNENAYQRRWPMRLLFCCLQPAASGGETPLAFIPNVTRRIAPEVIEEFGRRGVMYVRNYGHGVDLSWQTTFQTESREEVEAYCRTHDISWEWLPDDRLRTRQICPALARHPATGARLWFNQAHLFHVSSLGAKDAAMMRELFDEADLPRHSYFGDGGELPEAALAHIREAYDLEEIVMPWQQGDVMLLDNMLMAHARRPYTGKRTVLTAMGDLSNEADTRVQGR